MSIQSRIVRATVVSTGSNFAIATSGDVGYHLPRSSGPVEFFYHQNGNEVDYRERAVHFRVPNVDEDVALVASLRQRPGMPRLLVSRWGTWENWQTAVRRSELDVMYWFFANGVEVEGAPLRKFLRTPRSPQVISTKDPYARQYVSFLAASNGRIRVDQVGRWEKWDPATQSRVRCEDPRPVDPELEDRIAA